ncbi:methyl-accepting chemotaxis protein [Celerinatantimonas sp. YJH-8]|uniref:methyl-accepting chemotaxis protein n=1 Tax=Celerinatantimonas sp. YJH-8 TaxID=3228714 RepID=UPI0038C47568
MKQAMLSQWEFFITRISLKHKIYLLIVMSLFVMLGKLFFDAYLVEQDLDNTSIQMLQTDAKQIASLVQPHLSDEGYLNTITHSNLRYHLAILDQQGQLISGENPSQVPALKQILETQGIRILTWPIDDNTKLVLTQNKTLTNGITSRYVLRSVIATLVIALCFLVLMMAASRVLMKQVKLLQSQLHLMANKDFTLPNLMNSRDEFGQIEQAANNTRADLVKVFVQQRTTTDELQFVSEQMALCMDETKDATQEEFAQIELLASAMSEVAATIQEVATHAEQASIATNEANELAVKGNDNVSRSIKTISVLAQNIEQSSSAVGHVKERVERIGSVVETINSISEQTNLLALNAAIEAARAGEHGRGFAVVAEEVRNLAQRTQQATVEIQQMIEQLQTSAEEASHLMSESVENAEQSVMQASEAGEGLSLIVEQVKHIADMNFQIASASEQQSSVSEQMSENLVQVKELIQGSVTVMDELSETAQIIEKHGQQLDQMAKAFRVESDTDSKS